MASAAINIGSVQQKLPQSGHINVGVLNVQGEEPMALGLSSLQHVQLVKPHILSSNPESKVINNNFKPGSDVQLPSRTQAAAEQRKYLSHVVLTAVIAVAQIKVVHALHDMRFLK